MVADSAAPEARRPKGIFAPLAYRDFALLWGGFVVSHVGDSVQVHAQAWLVTDLTRSGLKIGGVALAQALPRLLLGLFAGVFVDRANRRTLLLVTQALAMAQSVLFLALVVTGRITYTWIVVLAAALGVFDTLNLNARISLMPSLVPRELIGKSVALQALGVNVVQIAGPAIAALLIGSFGVAGCLAANAATFVVLLVALFFVRPQARPAGGKPSEGFGSELREGLGFVRARPLLWGSIALAYLLGFFGVSAVRLLALYARVVVETTARGYGFLVAASGLGAIGASLLVTARARPEHLPRNIVASALVFSVALAVVGRAHGYPAAFAGLMLFGFAQMAFRSAVTTSLQLEVPDRMRGRVMSLLTLDFSLWSIGAAFSGAVADVFALRAARALPEAADVLARGVRDLAQLPHAAVGRGLTATFYLMGACCLLSTLVLARTILRARLSPSPVVRDDPAHDRG